MTFLGNGFSTASINTHSFMKKIIFHIATISLFLIFVENSSTAQTKRWEHNIYTSMGVVNKFDDYDHQRTAFHVGYGINYYFSSKWSVMPGVALRWKTLGNDNDISGNCTATHIDIPMLAQYHFGGDTRKGIVLECGPVISFLAHGRRYKIQDLCPGPFFSGEKMYKNFDLGIQPAAYYETSRWRFGVQSHIGLLDIKRKYPSGIGNYNSNLAKSYHSFDLVATINYHW